MDTDMLGVALGVAADAAQERQQRKRKSSAHTRDVKEGLTPAQRTKRWRCLQSNVSNNDDIKVNTSLGIGASADDGRNEPEVKASEIETTDRVSCDVKLPDTERTPNISPLDPPADSKQPAKSMRMDVSALFRSRSHKAVTYAGLDPQLQRASGQSSSLLPLVSQKLTGLENPGTKYTDMREMSASLQPLLPLSPVITPSTSSRSDTTIDATMHYNNASKAHSDMMFSPLEPSVSTITNTRTAYFLNLDTPKFRNVNVNVNVDDMQNTHKQKVSSLPGLPTKEVSFGNITNTESLSLHSQFLPCNHQAQPCSSSAAQRLGTYDCGIIRIHDGTNASTQSPPSLTQLQLDQRLEEPMSSERSNLPTSIELTEGTRDGMGLSLTEQRTTNPILDGNDDDLTKFIASLHSTDIDIDELFPDDEDPDYDFMAGELEIDDNEKETEEYRADRAVEISRREVQAIRRQVDGGGGNGGGGGVGGVGMNDKMSDERMGASVSASVEELPLLPPLPSYAPSVMHNTEVSEIDEVGTSHNTHNTNSHDNIRRNVGEKNVKPGKGVTGLKGNGGTVVVHSIDVSDSQHGKQEDTDVGFDGKERDSNKRTILLNTLPSLSTTTLNVVPTALPTTSSALLDDTNVDERPTPAVLVLLPHARLTHTQRGRLTTQITRLSQVLLQYGVYGTAGAQPYASPAVASTLSGLMMQLNTKAREANSHHSTSSLSSFPPPFNPDVITDLEALQPAVAYMVQHPPTHPPANSHIRTHTHSRTLQYQHQQPPLPSLNPHPMPKPNPPMADESRGIPPQQLSLIPPLSESHPLPNPHPHAEPHSHLPFNGPSISNSTITQPVTLLKRGAGRLARHSLVINHSTLMDNSISNVIAEQFEKYAWLQWHLVPTLPSSRVKPKNAHRIVFTKFESTLMVMALKHLIKSGFEVYPTSKLWEVMQKRCLPFCTVHQLFTRYKNMTLEREPDDPVTRWKLEYKRSKEKKTKLPKKIRGLPLVAAMPVQTPALTITPVFPQTLEHTTQHAKTTSQMNLMSSTAREQPADVGTVGIVTEGRTQKQHPINSGTTPPPHSPPHTQTLSRLQIMSSQQYEKNSTSAEHKTKSKCRVNSYPLLVSNTSSVVGDSLSANTNSTNCITRARQQTSHTSLHLSQQQCEKHSQHVRGPLFTSPRTRTSLPNSECTETKKNVPHILEQFAHNIESIPLQDNKANKRAYGDPFSIEVSVNDSNDENIVDDSAQVHGGSTFSDNPMPQKVLETGYVHSPIDSTDSTGDTNSMNVDCCVGGNEATIGVRTRRVNEAVSATERTAVNAEQVIIQQSPSCDSDSLNDCSGHDREGVRVSRIVSACTPCLGTMCNTRGAVGCTGSKMSSDSKDYNISCVGECTHEHNQTPLSEIMSSASHRILDSEISEFENDELTDTDDEVISHTRSHEALATQSSKKFNKEEVPVTDKELEHIYSVGNHKMMKSSQRELQEPSPVVERQSPTQQVLVRREISDNNFDNDELPDTDSESGFTQTLPDSTLPLGFNSRHDDSEYKALRRLSNYEFEDDELTETDDDTRSELRSIAASDVATQKLLKQKHSTQHNKQTFSPSARTNIAEAGRSPHRPIILPASNINCRDGEVSDAEFEGDDYSMAVMQATSNCKRRTQFQKGGRLRRSTIYGKLRSHTQQIKEAFVVREGTDDGFDKDELPDTEDESEYNGVDMMMIASDRNVEARGSAIRGGALETMCQNKMLERDRTVAVRSRTRYSQQQRQMRNWSNVGFDNDELSDTDDGDSCVETAESEHGSENRTGTDTGTDAESDSRPPAGNICVPSIQDTFDVDVLSETYYDGSRDKSEYAGKAVCTESHCGVRDMGSQSNVSIQQVERYHLMNVYKNDERKIIGIEVSVQSKKDGGVKMLMSCETSTDTP
eukprot:CFRG1821T1